MRDANTILNIHQTRGSEGLPLERVYRQLFNHELFLDAYGKIYRNTGAMTKGTTEETVDGMCLGKIHQIIALLKLERYRWTPVRRTEIPKPNGKKRPLGIPTWSDKLVQEVVRSLLEPYYEQRFSTHSHGFRPNRGCHSALLEIRKTWTGTVWFIEGDIKGCFDNIDHSVLLDIIRRDIHDGRLVALIDGMLRAGYMEDWRYHETTSGTPQGGIISPLLSNIYLNELDRFVEGTLIPAYTKGGKRGLNPDYMRYTRLIGRARKKGDIIEIKRLRKERRQFMSVAPVDPDHRRLRYVRYADDFLLGFVGPKTEAEEIRRRLSEFLEQKLKLTLSPEKTLITHATDDKARFLGYEIKVTRTENYITDGKRNANGRIALLMPRKVVHKYRQRYSSGGKIIHRKELLNESAYTIIQRYQSVLRGLYNYYCMAVNVGNRKRMSSIKWMLEVSLTKTLASKFKCKTTEIYRKFGAEILGRKALQVVIKRPDKEPLVATFGGFPFERIPEGMGVVDFQFQAAWHKPFTRRAEVVQRLLMGKCELCGVAGEPVQVHHVRKLADIDRPGRRPKTDWEKRMSVMKRKTLVVCLDCHATIHGGRYDGPRL
jgi:group II intron reverse transcriptase/maturase